MLLSDPSSRWSGLLDPTGKKRGCGAAGSDTRALKDAVRNVAKLRRARAFGPRVAVFEETAFGLGVDFDTGAGAGLEGRGTASMGMNVNAW